jgi:hypothetical protein
MRTIRFMKEIAACAAIVALCSGPGEARGQGTPISEASHPGSESEMARFFTGDPHAREKASKPSPTREVKSTRPRIRSTRSMT